MAIRWNYKIQLNLPRVKREGTVSETLGQRRSIIPWELTLGEICSLQFLGDMRGWQYNRGQYSGIPLQYYLFIPLFLLDSSVYKFHFATKCGWDGNPIWRTSVILAIERSICGSICPSTLYPGDITPIQCLTLQNSSLQDTALHLQLALVVRLDFVQGSFGSVGLPKSHPSLLFQYKSICKFYIKI